MVKNFAQDFAGNVESPLVHEHDEDKISSW